MSLCSRCDRWGEPLSQLLKILYLDQTAELGGAELSLLSEVTNLPFGGSVLLFEDGPLRETLAAAGVEVEVAGRVAGALAVRRQAGLMAALRAVPAVLRLVVLVARRARAYDIIYANSQKAFVVAALAAFFTRRTLVWHLHDVLDATHFSGLMRRAAVVLANARASLVIANSRATAAAFERVGGDGGRVTVLHQGIDEAVFAAVTPAQVAAARAELNPGGAPMVGVFSRLAPWKGQAVFLEALAQVPDAVGVIVGGALFGEEAYAAELAARAAALGLTARVRFLGFRRDVPALMCAMDLIVHSSIAPEPFGRVVVEGMLAAKPVLASAAGGVPEIIEDGKTGFLYQPGNVAALAAAMRGILAAPEMAAAVALAGRMRAGQVFSVAAKNSRLVEILSGAVR